MVRSTRNLVPPDLSDPEQWQSRTSIWHAHPTNHRMAPGGRVYDNLYQFVKAQIRPGDWVLDVGCNCGQMAINLTKELGCHVCGFDLVPEFVRHCNEEKGEFITAWCADFTRLTAEEIARFELDQGRFDVVTALGVLEHPIHIGGFRRNTLLALGGKGRLVIATPHPDSPFQGYGKLRHTPGHVRMWSKLRLEMAFGPISTYEELYVEGELSNIGAMWEW